MAFDQATRKRLQDFVSDARGILEEEFTRQLQNDYGMDPASGEVAHIASLRHINDAQRETCRILRDTLLHYTASAETSARSGLSRIVREQAFTVLNRLAALRMAEARGLLVESVGGGFQAKGFQLYSRLAGVGLGETGDAYRAYLFSVFDEFAQDLPKLFDRFSPQGRLFPREAALVQLLKLINSDDIALLWSQDETIGWVYQYFNDPDERKRMRDPKQGGSQVPRNSRELAVRNQFFTPRYVVEFLVDNTLGRLWFTATKGETCLRDRCKYLVKLSDQLPPTSGMIRDPRTLKLLDPACGSMHFGLYAFDLFIEIYREAWQWERRHGPGSLGSHGLLQNQLEPLGQTYTTEAEYLQDVPRLIIEYNIYGVDIDPRASQIASLALWLRAQRAWNDAGVKAKDRPAIGQGHVIAAMAPPAERDLREEFTARLEKRDAQLFEGTLQLLKGLPELGLLLKVERELPVLIRQAYVGRGTGLFAREEQDDWRLAEARLRVGLADFARAASSTYRGRLFAADALEGLRLIDLAREKFDVVLMNPPFGAPTEGTYDYVRENYSGFHGDIYASFVARANELSASGYVGCISSRSFLMSPRLEAFRSSVVLQRLVHLVDFGLGVMDDAHVEAAAYVLGPNGAGEFSVLDLRRSEAKREEALAAAVATSEVSILKQEWFLALPQAKILYAAPARVRTLLSSSKYFEPAIGTAREGMKSFDNFRFIRLWWEVAPSRIGRGNSWVRFSKGGEYSFFYLDTHLLLNWENDGAQLKEINRELNGSTAQVRQASDYWYRSGVTYSKRSAKGFSARILPADTIFTSNGPAVLSESKYSALYLLGWINSKLVRGFIHLQSNFGDYSTGSLKRLPWVDPSAASVQSIEAATGAAVSSSLALMSQTEEVSPRFAGYRIEESFSATVVACRKLAEGKDRDSEHAISLAGQLLAGEYAIDDMGWVDELVGSESEVEQFEPAAFEDSSDPLRDLSTARVASDIVSYVMGCAFGRWVCGREIGGSDGSRPVSAVDALSALPRTPPCQSSFQDNWGESVTLVAGQGSSKDGVLDSSVDSSGSLIKRMREAFDRLFKTYSSAWEDELCAALRVSKLVEYMQRPSGFFASHLLQYSISGRQAPIYWPLSTASQDYTVWIYYSKLTDQTLYGVVNNFVEPKLRQVASDAVALRAKGTSRTREEERQLEFLQRFESELVEMHDCLLELAPRYKPALDDGVQICAAPLWSLFRHKPWQKVLRDTWVRLEKGEYDWAKLAMKYWPERVREKCKTDKSLAIAHGLEHLYVEPIAPTKKPRGRRKVGGDE